MVCAPSEESDQPESSLCAQWVAKDPSFLHADSDQTGHTSVCWFCHEAAQLWCPHGSGISITTWSFSKQISYCFTITYKVGGVNLPIWMDELRVLRLFQQYFSHFETMQGGT